MISKSFVVVFTIIFAKSFNISYACSMEGVTNWFLPVTKSIYDTYRGIFFQRNTSGIAAINTVTYSEGLNAGPYISVSYNESKFTIATNDQYESYEERENVDLMGVTVVFRCTGGTLSTLVFSINVIDTNNNSPQFLPNDNYNFKIAPPVPPGFLITDCINDIIARDIDLTTERIHFQLGEHPYFEIAYKSSATPKEFKAILRTTSFIRRISEPIILRISATDVDRTGDPPLTANATIRIEADSEFEFPDDLIFSETFYIATYADGHEIILEKAVYLRQGYDENVTFTLEGDYKEYFETVINGNNVGIKTQSQLPADILRQTQIYFVIRASREHTSGSTATVILKLHKEINLEFEKDFYVGSILNNSLVISNLLLQGDYQNDALSVIIYSEFSHFFTTNVQMNIVTLHMDPLDDNIIKENNILMLQMIATINETSAKTIVALEIMKDDHNTPVFEKNIYNATYNPVVGVTLENIVIIQGYDETVTVSLAGEHENYFQIIKEGALFNINSSSIPSDVLRDKYILLIIKATKPRTVGAHAVIYIDMTQDSDDINVFFDKLHYAGDLRGGDIAHETIFVSGYNGTRIDILGDHADVFLAQINEGEVTVQLRDSTTFPVNTSHVVLELHVPGAGSVLILEVVGTDTENNNVFFDKLHYAGDLRGGDVAHETIFVSGYNGTRIDVLGDHADVFLAQINEGIVTVQLRDSTNFPVNTSHVVLELHVPGAGSVLLLEVVGSDTENNNVFFDKLHYAGNLRGGDVAHETIFVFGYNGTRIDILGDHADVFLAQINEGIVTIQLRDSNTFPANTSHVVLELHVPGAGSVLILEVVGSDTENNNVFFDKLHYAGDLRGGDVAHETIFVSGYNGTRIDVLGDHADVFLAQINEGIVTVQLRDSTNFPVNTSHVVLELHVPGAGSVLILEVVGTDTENNNVFFDKLHYAGDLRGGDVAHETIFVSGYNGTRIDVLGDHADVFLAQINDGVVTVQLRDSTTFPVNTSHVVLELHVPGAGSVLILKVVGTESEDYNVFFDKLRYTGILRRDYISHEPIFVSGYNGTSVNILGDYADVFLAQINAGIVTVQLRGSTTTNINASHVVLELHVPGAGSVLILEVTNSDNPDQTRVRFSSESYIIRVEISQTGLVGHVTASADNGEAVAYSLLIENVPLQERMSINNNGELYLSAPASSGLHTFQVIATSIFTRVNGTATVHLTVEAATICSNDVVVPPLIVIDRDEEAPHENLVTLNTTIFQDCHYVLSNRWPVNQTWLYVDENGLHTRAIDREHQSIAFMALSQIQVELVLQCKSDQPNTRNKRSLSADVEPNSLGPYDYGSHKWVLTDTILYNARRSFVNLIVNDINDNDPVFTSKENEPIAVGYPLPELVEMVSPRSLVELKATDADIGENAALVYWSSEPNLSVSPSSGYVHVYNNAQLENGARLTVNATDRNGLGRTGSIDLVVRLLDVNRIAVVTIRGAFLEDEKSILSDLSKALGYEIKPLRAVVIPQDYVIENKEIIPRNKREYTDSNEALLQLYIYALIDREPIEVNQLISDLNNNIITVNVTSTVSLEDHLESREICPIPERDTGLLAATIALSILLFGLIMVLALWFFLKCSKKQTYENFSDENSLSSRNHSIQQPPNTDEPAKARLNLDELKKSEKRLQEVLDVSIKQPDAEPSSQKEVSIEPMVNLSSPELRMPIVIQSIDKLKDAIETSEDEDEFGETEKAPRKSVVTFNENVEKIIHLVDNPDDPDYEVYKF